MHCGFCIHWFLDNIIRVFKISNNFRLWRMLFLQAIQILIRLSLYYSLTNIKDYKVILLDQKFIKSYALCTVKPFSFN